MAGGLHGDRHLGRSADFLEPVENPLIALGVVRERLCFFILVILLLYDFITFSYVSNILRNTLLTAANMKKSNFSGPDPN